MSDSESNCGMTHKKFEAFYRDTRSTARTLSASCASLAKSMLVPVEARTIHTLVGSHCRISLRRNELLSDVSPISH